MRWRWLCLFLLGGCRPPHSLLGKECDATRDCGPELICNGANLCARPETDGGTVRPFPPPVTTQTVIVPASIDKTGTTDVSVALQMFVDSVADGSIISFPENGTYRLGAGVLLTGRSNLIFEGNGSTLRTTGDGAESNSHFYLHFNDSHITLQNFTLLGSNPTPGQQNPGGEFAAAVTIYGGTYIEVANVTITGVYGDGVTANGASADVWVHDSHVVSCGRSGVTVMWGSNVTVERNAIDTAGLATFDVNPQIASDGQLLIALVFRNNTAGTWNGSAGFFFGAAGNETTLVRDVTVSGNTITGNTLQTFVHVGSGAGRRKNIVFTKNTAVQQGAIGQGAPGMLWFQHVDGLTVTGNSQTVTNGPLVSISDSTAVVDSPNP